MDYPALIHRLCHRGLFRIKPGLERVREVLRVLNHPQERIAALHVAGTNGKGSVAACLESVLRAAGYRTGLYTSPHLFDVRERIQIDRQPISISRFWETAQSVLDAEQVAGFALTYFEFLTVMAFVYFAQEAVEIAVIETGMGGRWDATNVIQKPLLTLITSIGLDHTQWLGRTESSVAREKAGILKPGIPVLCGARGAPARVIAGIARRAGAPLWHIDNDFRAKTKSIDWLNAKQILEYDGLGDTHRQVDLGLLGRYQVDNAALVLAGLEKLSESGWKIPNQAVAQGLAQVAWPGRFQLVRLRAGPTVLFDGAHNPPALRLFLETLDQSPWRKTPKTFVFGVYRDKDHRQMVKQVLPHADQLVLCTLPGPRSLPATRLGRAIRRLWQSVDIVGDPHRAFDLAVRKTAMHNLVVVTGSLALVGMLLEDLKAKEYPESLDDGSGSVAQRPTDREDFAITPAGKTHA